MNKISKWIGPALTGSAAIATWFTRATFEAWFFDKVLHEVVEPRLGSLIEYGPPGAFALVCVYLIVGRNRIAVAGKRETTTGKAEAVYPPGAKPISRIAVLDFYKQVQRSGIDLMGNSLRALTIAKDIQQAALDGELQTWGKQGPLSSVLVKIPSSHWKDFRLYWEPCFKYDNPGIIVGFADDNSMVGTNGARTTYNHRTGYVDVYLDLDQAKKLVAR